MLICPNLSDPTWKALEKEVGYDRAMEIFAENNNNIPDGIVNRVSSPLFKKVNKVINENPEIANKVIERLKAIYPDVSVDHIGVMTNEGFVELGESREGIHYRNAIGAAVAWANDASIEVPPHEYAHDYLQLFRNTPEVQTLFKEYGEELTTTYMGRYFANKIMSDSFIQRIKNFFKMIKYRFSAPSLLEIVSEKFYKGEDLGQKEAVTKPKISNFSKTSVPHVALKQLKMFAKTAVTAIAEISSTEVKSQLYNKMKSMDIITDETKIYSSEKYSSPSSEKAAKQVLDTVIAMSKNMRLVENPDGTSHYTDAQGNIFQRTTSIINPNFEMNPKYAGALNIGTNIDTMMRDFFMGDKLVYSKYKQYMTQDAFDSLHKDIKALKKKLDADGITVISGYVNKDGVRSDIILRTNQKVITPAHPNGVLIAGSVDLLAYDKDGNIFIWDMKTMRSNMDFYETRDKEGLSKKDKHEKQLNMYREMFEEATQVQVSGVSIIPIKVFYEPYQTVTTQAALYETIAIDKISMETALGMEESELDAVIDTVGFAGLINKAKRRVRQLSNIKDPDYYSTTQKQIDKMFDDLLSDDTLLKRIALYIAGDSRIKLSPVESELYYIMESLFKTIIHKETINQGYIDENGFIIDKTVVNEQNISEIQKQNEFRKSRREKLPSWYAKIEAGLNNVLHYVTNDRLISKLLGGSEESVISQFIYKTMERAQNDFHDLMFKVKDAIGTIPKWISDGSSHINGAKHMKDIASESFKLTEYDKNTDTEESVIVDLTLAEILHIYMYSRQEGIGSKLIENGISLQHIEGRNSFEDRIYRISAEELDRIIHMVDSNAELSEMVVRSDKAFKEIRDAVNPKFRVMEGYDVSDIPFYFPTAYGSFTDTLKVSKNTVENYSGLRVRQGSDQSLRVDDFFKIIDNAKMAASNYSAYAIPIRNADEMLANTKKNFERTDISKWIESLKETVKRYDDPAKLYYGDNEAKYNKLFRSIQGNLAVSVLAKNIGVVFKQQVSLQTATNYIDNKYLVAAGESIGPLAFVSPMKLFKLLNVTGFKGGDTWMPIEWGNLQKDADLLELLNIPTLRARFEGVSTIELGEAVLGKNYGEDNINLTKLSFGYIKNKDGSIVNISKSRLLKSITLMDALTILHIYKGVKLETAEKHGNLSAEEQQEISNERILDIIAKSQPTFDYSNRTGLAKQDDAISRSLTMFTSATQKIQMLLIEKWIDFVNNPNVANRKALLYAMFNVAVVSSAMLTSINLARAALFTGWDDDDDEKLAETYMWDMATNSLGTFHVIGGIVNMVANQQKGQSFRSVIQSPQEKLIQDFGQAAGSFVSGDILKGLDKSLAVTANITGLPVTPYTSTKNVAKRIVEN